MNRRPSLQTLTAGWAFGLVLGWSVGFGWIPSSQAEPYVPAFERSGGDGHVLFSELGCANCHGPTLEFARRGPDLSGMASRFRADWVRQFLADPGAARPGSNMPAMFSGPDDPRIKPILHYLMSRPAGKQKAKKVSFGKDVNAERGSELFHTIGCATCHDPSPDFQPPGGRPQIGEFTVASVAFPDLRAKYSLESLARFLAQPGITRPGSRMPDLGLSPTEALDVAGHLFDFQDSDPRNAPPFTPFVPDPVLAKEGAGHYAKMGCAACHEAKPTAPAVPIRTWEGGCLTSTPGGNLPSYPLSTRQREAFLRTTEFQPPHPVSVLNCLACHAQDGAGGPDAARGRYFTGDEALGDTGRLPPPLTGIGRKLRPEWMEGVFAGTHRVRPYVRTRMPLYEDLAKSLTVALTPTSPSSLPPLASDPDREAGRKLLGIQGGVNCITCHQWGERPSLGIQALDISQLDQRLQPDWFRDYLLNPAGYRPGTLMPPLWPGGQSMIQDVLGGSAERQISSIWEFIAYGEGIPEGFPDVASGAFELVPKDRPILQRAFLNGVGPNAILVGFPGGVNLAYNGETGAPGLMWRGRFFDAYSTWFVRSAPFENPLGTDVLSWSTAEPTPAVDRFQGYRLGPDGTPFFLLRIGGVAIEDHFQAVEGSLRRTLTWEPGGAEPTWLHPNGATVTEEPESKSGRRIFTYSWEEKKP